MANLEALRQSRRLSAGMTSAAIDHVRDSVSVELSAVTGGALSAAYWVGHIDAALRLPKASSDETEYKSGRELGEKLVLINGCNRYVDNHIARWKRRNFYWKRGSGMVYAESRE